MASFHISYGKTMAHEGVYSNDPSDRGGETYKGIARKFHSDWKGWSVIDEVKEQVNVSDLNKTLEANTYLNTLVRFFYKQKFWDKLQLDSINGQELADELFDTAVNQGVKTAAYYFQRSLNFLNNNQKHYSDIKEDGMVGAQTIKAFNAYMLTAMFSSRSTARNIHTLIKSISFFQMQRYVEICENNPRQEVFFYGWLNRV
ncbi:glycosyl hydrolase 108 family protein [uncultured Draconibacterium sp.]|uniref:glycoside hydrolase family 108 protein n=1 Tax=uncultured Draconibacterium sp. TaxID=1573823 RepID=UPI0025E0F799|nr:glycosyl hydrolase 108 family protein [uncultured Draconibacterium sp.]